MPEYIYHGPAKVFKKAEDDNGTERGGTITLTEQAMKHHSRGEAGGHRFTPVSEAKAAEVNAAKAVNRDAAVAAKAGDAPAN